MDEATARERIFKPRGSESIVGDACSWCGSYYKEEPLRLRAETREYGFWPECAARVVALRPDPAAPEIVMQVSHPTHGEIGVFKWELVRLVWKDVGDLAWEKEG